jgi:hypothetical protein
VLLSITVPEKLQLLNRAPIARFANPRKSVLPKSQLSNNERLNLLFETTLSRNLQLIKLNLLKSICS